METVLKDTAAAGCLCGRATWAVTSCQLSEGPWGVLAALGRTDALERRLGDGGAWGSVSSACLPCLVGPQLTPASLLRGEGLSIDLKGVYYCHYFLHGVLGFLPAAIPLYLPLPVGPLAMAWNQPNEAHRRAGA